MSEVKLMSDVEPVTLGRDEVAFTADFEGSSLYLPKSGPEGLSHLTADQMVVIACFMRAGKDKEFYEEMIEWIEATWLNTMGEPLEKVVEQ